MACQSDIYDIIRRGLKIHPPETSWEWASKHVDYSRAPNYDTPYKGLFDPELMPFWKEPLEMMQDRDVREVVVLKCSRDGYSENLVLTDLRYTIARNPEPTMYITGSMELTKGFVERRVKRGMRLASETSKEYRSAKETGTDIQFPGMDFRATWATSNTGKKQDGWARLYLDEFSLFDGFSVDMYRRRCAAYPFHHILFGSALDPERRGNPEDDPALVMYLDSDRRKWFMNDPAGGIFLWDMGDQNTIHGIKWPKECQKNDEWDLDAVREAAYYMTPGGERVEEKYRMEMSRSGFWVPERKHSRKGYMPIAPMVPFSDCTFGAIAVSFLSAKHNMRTTGSPKERNRNTLRTFFAEYWARAHRDQEQETTEDALTHCEADYAIGKPPVPEGWTCGNYATVDVQKTHLWFVIRQWAINYESKEVRSALVDFGTVASFEDLDVTLAQYEPALVGIDIGYALRQSEVADYCAMYTDRNPKESRVIALRGSDTLKATAMTWTVRDALEGRSSGGGMSPYLELTWSPDLFRTWLAEGIDEGKEWLLPNEWGDERKRTQYARQLTSTKKIDGEWIPPKHGQDHLFDCESMQMVLARHDGLI